MKQEIIEYWEEELKEYEKDKLIKEVLRLRFLICSRNIERIKLKEEIELIRNNANVSEEVVE